MNFNETRDSIVVCTLHELKLILLRKIEVMREVILRGPLTSFCILIFKVATDIPFN